jgi:hypothetical protein
MNWYNTQKFCQGLGMEIPHLKTQSEIDEVRRRIPEGE